MRACTTSPLRVVVISCLSTPYDPVTACILSLSPPSLFLSPRIASFPPAFIRIIVHNHAHLLVFLRLLLFSFHPWSLSVFIFLYFSLCLIFLLALHAAFLSSCSCYNVYTRSRPRTACLYCVHDI
ncbi:hypothetical protein BDV98DRAFT_259576 [Pterulicium gracile]|uniref:Uncharacterized protein n=1 Tax=Pterulicium gracile TaxID=1884261 RepID=A0A5C3Q6G1_9AGAR|nr:hypothetical protein BDV98DRAFT_259576 [Pterula gracilis]